MTASSSSQKRFGGFRSRWAILCPARATKVEATCSTASTTRLKSGDRPRLSLSILASGMTNHRGGSDRSTSRTGMMLICPAADKATIPQASSSKRAREILLLLRGFLSTARRPVTSTTLRMCA